MILWEEDVRHSVPGRGIAHALYERKNARPRRFNIAAWLADFWEAILGREPKR